MKNMNPKPRYTTILIFLLLLILSACNSSEAPHYRIGLISGSPIFDTAFDGFKQEMANQGFIEGDNVTYFLRSADGNTDEMRKIAEQYVADDVDLIFTTTNGAAEVARQVTEESGIPVVFAFVIAPVESGIVADLRFPGANVTGVRNPLEDYVGRRISLMLEMSPETRTIWAPYDRSYPTVTTVFNKLHDLAPELGITLVETEIDSPQAVVEAIEGFDKDNLPFDAIFIFPDLKVQQAVAWEAILNLATEYNLPILANTSAQVNAGALFSYLIDNVATGQQCARIAAQILNGAKPSDLPVETAELSLMLNLDNAAKLGLDVSSSVIASAQTVIRTDSSE